MNTKYFSSFVKTKNLTKLRVLNKNFLKSKMQQLKTLKYCFTIEKEQVVNYFHYF